MKLSLEWISQYVDIHDIDPQALALRMTMATAEVEGCERLDRATKGVVAADILSAQPVEGHPGLTVVEVDTGGGKRFRTVCGAPNARAGLRAAFAPAGAELAGGKRVESSLVAGLESQGILCSARELGLSEFHEILFEIPQSVPVGASLSDLIPPSDHILEIDNKSLTHRPDLWGHYGMAREVAAVLGRPLRPLAMQDLAAYSHLPAYPLRVDDFENCPAYCCIEIDRIGLGPAPLELQWRLHAVGQRTHDLLVDLTNYLMLEMGQPMHAFDGAGLKAVRVAPLGQAAEFTTLDGQRRKMLPEDLMIWNETQPVAVAGVMGGLDTEVTPQTTRLLLESANFKGSRIRRTAIRLDLRSDASMRFEKNQPPANAKLAIGRFLRLLHDAGQNPQVLSRLTAAGDLKEDPRPLSLPMEYFHRRIGMQIPDEKILSILRSLGFGAEIECGQLRLQIPPFRSAYDIAIPPDIVEEVSRIYGFDNIAPQMPTIPTKPVRANQRLALEHKARRILAQAHGFAEAHSYSWFDDSWLRAIGFDPGPTLTLKNPSAEEQSRMRTCLTPNLLAHARLNRAHRDRFQMFELGRVFQPDGPAACAESTRLAGVSCRNAKSIDLESHLLEIKGALEDTLAAVAGGACPAEFIPSKANPAPWARPNSHMDIRIGEKTIGRLGYLGGAILEEIGPNTQVCWFELDFDALEGPEYPLPVYDPPSAFPGSWFDASIVWDSLAGYAALEQKLDRFADSLIRKREFLGVYKGKGLDPGKGSFSFRYYLGSMERTLSGDEIAGCFSRFIQFLQAEGLALR